MADDQDRENTRQVLEKYGEQVLPACLCFSRDAEGLINDTGLQLIQTAMQAGQMLGEFLQDMGVCPTAAPNLIAIAADLAMIDFSIRSAERKNAAPTTYDVLDEQEALHDLLSAQLRHHRQRVRPLINKGRH